MTGTQPETHGLYVQVSWPTRTPMLNMSPLPKEFGAPGSNFFLFRARSGSSCSNHARIILLEPLVATKRCDRLALKHCQTYEALQWSIACLDVAGCRSWRCCPCFMLPSMLTISRFSIVQSSPLSPSVAVSALLLGSLLGVRWS